MDIIIFSSKETNEFFFSVEMSQKHNLGDSFTSKIHTLNYLDDSDNISNDIDAFIYLYYSHMNEIPNPDLSYIPYFI